MESLHVGVTLPEQDLFAFTSMNHPAPIPPAPVNELSVMHPFNIPANLFTAALDPKVPLAIAAVYAVTVKALSRYNNSRGRQPWAISKTRGFFAFVVAHNIFLAVYSAWTCVGFFNVLRRSVTSPLGPEGLAGTADSICHVHGTPGLGNSVYYDDTLGHWTSATSHGAVLHPDTTQQGRLWNEGLAYFGWIFYLSKFYEVLDTFIILAKGKPSSTLQTYHHAGAMMCMWAGIRFMSSPIWIFIQVNSFIHAIMYTYYTLTAFRVKVPVAFKRTLTTMQITQFVCGGSLAMFNSFVAYLVPITTSEILVKPSSSQDDTVLPSVAAGAFNSLRQIIFSGTTNSSLVNQPAETVYVAQPCATSIGETFAIWLNVLYLAPLTYLFVSFFITSYVKRHNAASKLNGKADRRLSNNVTMAEKAGWEAARSVEREVYGGETMVNGSAVVDATGVKPNASTTRRRA